MNIYCLCDLIYTYLPKEIYCNDKVSTAHSVTATSIAATLFLWFMAGNGILYNPDGSKRIADNTLVALTLMIAESRTEEKDGVSGKSMWVGINHRKPVEEEFFVHNAP